MSSDYNPTIISMLDLIISSRASNIGAAIAASFTTIFILLFAFRQFRSSQPRNNEPPIYPYWIPWLGHAIAFFRNQEALHGRARAHFGSDRPFRLLIAGKTFYIVSNPKDTAAVLRNTKTLQFDGFSDDIIRKLGVSDEGMKILWTPQDDEAASYRNDPVLMTNSHDFYRDHLAPGPDMEALGIRYLNYIDQHSDEALFGSGARESWNQGKAKEILFYTWVRDFMSTAVTDAVFGHLLIETTPNFIETLWKFDDNIWKLLYQVPKYFSKEAHEAKTGMVDAFEKYDIAWNNSRNGKNEDLGVLQKRYDMLKAASMNKRDIAAATVSVSIGLYANAPKATFWALLYILATPGLAKKIRQETSKAFPATGRRIPNLDYLVSSCPYLIASISETLRLASHSNSTRLVDEDTVINGYLLRKGAVIMSPSSHLHVDPSWGPDTLSFNPERFISDQSLDKANNQNYRPFGGGRTYCPGRFLAKQEISGFIAIMLDRYDMELISEVPAMNRTKFSLGTLEPVDPRQVIVRVRGLVKD